MSWGFYGARQKPTSLAGLRIRHAGNDQMVKSTSVLESKVTIITHSAESEILTIRRKKTGWEVINAGNNAVAFFFFIPSSPFFFFFFYPRIFVLNNWVALDFVPTWVSLNFHIVCTNLGECMSITLDKNQKETLIILIDLVIQQFEDVVWKNNEKVRYSDNRPSHRDKADSKDVGVHSPFYWSRKQKKKKR